MKKVVLTAFGVLFLASTYAQAQLPTFDHIAVIIADDLGVDMLSCFDGVGQDLPNTPNICALASTGRAFDNAWSNSSCSPTRSTIQTGKYIFQTLVWRPGAILDVEETTIPEVLSQQSLGFESAVIGKWHLGGTNRGCPSLSPIYPTDQGYDFFSGAYSNISGLGGQGYNNWCRVEVSVSGTPTIGQCEADPSSPFTRCRTQPYATIVHTQEAIDWVNQRQGKFFLWLAYNAPHEPFTVPPQNDPACDGPCYSGPALLDCSNARDCYKAMIEVMDNQIGELLDALPANTLVVFIGDNGTPSQVVDSCLSGREKGTVFEGGVNVPLVIRGPMVPPARSDALVNLADLFPSILEWAGATPPTADIDGVSLIPLFLGSTSVRDFAFTERRLWFRNDYEVAARNDRYKMIQSPNVGSDIKLFDLSIADPCLQEVTDLYDDSAPNLTSEEQIAFDELTTFLNTTIPDAPACPATYSCDVNGCSKKSPPQCALTDLGFNNCLDLSQQLFDCPVGQTVWSKECDCTGPPGTLCLNNDRSLICQ